MNKLKKWLGLTSPSTEVKTEPGVTVKVVCPVCMAGIEYHHKESFAWGMASLTDLAEVEITAHDGGKIRDHMTAHVHDGTWAAALRKRAEALTVQADRAEGLRKQ